MNSLNKNTQPLRVNVGFVLKKGVGYSRELPFDEPILRVADDLTVAQLHGSLTLTRTPQGLYAKGTLRARTPTECVKCLVPIEQSVTSRIDELFFYPPEDAPEGSPVVGEDVHLDLTPLVREDMLLSLPMRILCKPDCKGLCPECGQNLNEGACTCAAEEHDPRWRSLSRLSQDSSE